MSPIEYNPLAPHIRANPYPTYSELRRDAPVYRVPGMELLAVSRHANVAAILRDPGSFSSSAMHDLMMRAGSAGSEEEDGDGDVNSLLGADPPAHTRMRKIVNRGFTRSRIAKLEGQIQEIAGDLVDRLIERERFDAVADFAVTIPVKVIARVLGIDESREADFKRWSDALLMGASAAMTDEEAAYCGRCHDELRSYLDEVAEQRRRDPGDDLISALVRAEDGEGRLTEDEIGTFTTLLLIAGNETTTHLIANATLALLEYPEQRELLRSQPELVDSLVEEALRYDTPIQVVLRTTTCEVEIAGERIPAGTVIAPLIGSANRDEAVFEAAERFDIRRNAQEHLAFGLGTHFCLGAPLARLEARIALGTLFGRLPDLQFAGDSISDLPRVSSLLVRGPLQLPIQCAGRARRTTT